MSHMAINPESGQMITMDDKRRQCLAMRQYFSSHYSAKPEEQEVILDHALALEQNDVIVELGVCNGQTAAMLAQSTAYTKAFYYGIDFFGLECSKAELDEKFADLNLDGQIIEGRTQDIGRNWNNSLKMFGKVVSSAFINLLFIDAGHDEANVKTDIEIWLPLLKPGGVVIFHDYDDPFNPDSPHWAVRYYADIATGFGQNKPGDDYGNTAEWVRQIVHSMLIARKPSQRTNQS